MKQQRIFILVISLCTAILPLSAERIDIQKASLVGDRIVEFVPTGYDPLKTPSLILKEEPLPIGNKPGDWPLIPEYTLTGNKASASLSLSGEISLYGGGEVTGPLLRNDRYIKLWNTDTGAYGVDEGKRLYQSHPWVMGVRENGSAFGIIFDSSWKSELYTNTDKITFNTEGALFRIYIIDRESPQAVLKGLAELTGTIQMPPRWTLGYHQSRFSYGTEARVREIASSFREKKIPCDVIWMDIDYMDGYRIFTFNPYNFPNPRSLNDDLHKQGFRAVYMIDPGVKVDNNYAVYQSGSANGVWVKKPDGEEYHGKVWPGDCAFPDFTSPDVRQWWANLYQDFLAKGIDGVWNDMNEPAVNDSELPENQRLGTMPYDTPHKGGGNLPPGTHLLYHNAYGRLMVEASQAGIMAANPDRRPFLLTRANLLGGQRYAATWTGDNWAGWEHLKLSVPMSITLGLSGQAFNGPDIGGFLNNTDGDLWANWLGFGVFLPFVRGHACAGTNDKEPWAWGDAIEKTSRIALQRRYRLLPYIYTLFHEAHQTGLPVMAPAFFANPEDLRLRTEEEAFLLGENLLVIPSFATNPALPSGIWEEISLVDGDISDKYQAKLKIRGGSIIPAGKIIQNTGENSFDPLTLIVCLDEQGKAEGELYTDSGDGWDFRNGDYSLITFTAERKGDSVEIKAAGSEGNRNAEQEIKKVDVELLLDGKIYKASGTLSDGVIVRALHAIVASLEAETGVLTAPAKVKYVNGYSGNAYVGDNDPGSSIVFSNVEIPKEGTYEFRTYYTSMQNRSIAVKANNFAEVISTITATTPDWNAPPVGTMSVYIYLKQGQNTIRITPYPSGQGAPNMDKFEIWTTGEDIPLAAAVNISGGNAITACGGNLQLSAVAEPQNSFLPAITWSVDNEEVARITEAGKLHALANGTVNVTVTATLEEVATLTDTKEITISNQSVGDYSFTVMGSSVPWGSGADPREKGYAWLWTNYLSQNATHDWSTNNISVGGNTTTDVTNRWDNDLLPSCSRYVYYGLSLGNEGVHERGQAAFDSWRDNMLALIERTRNHGKIPLVGNNYPRGDFNATDYNYVKQLNLLVHEWDVPSINLLGAIDNGAGRWASGFIADNSHPNTAGHAEMFYAVVPSLLDAIAGGKPQPLRTENTFLSLEKNDKAGRIIFTPEGTLHSFTFSFAFKTTGTGTIASFVTSSGNTERLILGGDGKLTYKTQTSSSALNDGNRHTATLTHYYARGKTQLYIDGAPVPDAGLISEKLVPVQFRLNDFDDVPHLADYGELFLFRAGMTAEEIQALHSGRMLKSSLEIYAPLNGSAPTEQEALENRAQSLNVLQLEEQDVTAINTVNGAGRFLPKDIYLYTITGQKLLHTDSESALSLQKLPAGLYLLKSIDSKGNTQSKKLIIK